MITRRQFLAGLAGIAVLRGFSMAVPPDGLTTFTQGVTFVMPDWLNAVDGMLRRGAYNVRSATFGAVADGVTADTTAINAAATAANAAGGGVVYLPTGNYKVGGLANSYDNVVFVGDGPGRTIVTGTASTAQMFPLTGVSYGGVIGMTIAGPTTGTTCVPVYVYQSDHIILRDLIVTGGVRAGMYIAESSTGVIEHVIISDTRLDAGAGGRGLWFFAGSNNWHCRNLRLIDTQGNALDLDASSPPSTEAVCSGHQYHGLYIENSNNALSGSAIDMQSAQRNTFTDVTLRQCDSAGITITADQAADDLGGSNDNVFEGVTMFDVASTEIYIFGSQRNRISGLKIYNATKAAGGHPVHFEAATVGAVNLPCSYNTVDGVDIVATNAYDHPVSHVATAAVQVVANVVRFGRPFSYTNNASSVAQASNVVQNVTEAGPLFGKATWNPGDLAADAQETTTVTVTGALLGDIVDGVSFSLDLQGMQLTGYVSASDTVTVVLNNTTAGNLNLSSGTVRVCVRRFINS